MNFTTTELDMSVLAHPTRLDAVLAVVKDLNIRAKRLGLNEVSVRTAEVLLLNEQTGFLTEVYINVHITGIIPCFDQWAVIATRNYVDGVSTINKVMVGNTLPTMYETAPLDCDHCHTNHERHKTIVLYNSSEDRYIQVGSSCITRFTTIKNAEKLIEWLELLAQLSQKFDQEERGNGHGSRPMYATLEYMMHVCALVRKHGYISKAKAKDGQTPTSIAAMSNMADARMNLTTYSNRFSTVAIKNYEVPTQADHDRAIQVIEWARRLVPTSEYERNMRLSLTKELLDEKFIGFAASAVVGYSKVHDPKEKKDAKVPSEWMGEEKGSIRASVVVASITPYETSGFGGGIVCGNIVRFRTPTNALLIWFTSSDHPFGVGELATIKATVKKHEIYRDEKQTIITRVKVVD